MKAPRLTGSLIVALICFSAAAILFFLNLYAWADDLQITSPAAGGLKTGLILAIIYGLFSDGLGLLKSVRPNSVPEFVIIFLRAGFQAVLKSYSLPQRLLLGHVEAEAEEAAMPIIEKLAPAAVAQPAPQDAPAAADTAPAPPAPVAAAQPVAVVAEQSPTDLTQVGAG
jgi:hypothetical protein